jgi:hypothetical protein
MNNPYDTSVFEKHRWLSTIPSDRSPSLTLGLDLGQSRNYTALAVLERNWVQATPEQFLASAGRGYAGYFDYRITRLERLDLGTSYVDVAHHVKDYLDSRWECPYKTLVMDATGVGSAVRDLFRTMKLNARMVSVSIIGGSNTAVPGTSRGASGQVVVTSRSEILTKLVTSVEQAHFTIDDKLQEHRETLFNEMLSLRPTGKPPFTDPGEGQDDLAFAVALAIWWGLK